MVSSIKNSLRAKFLSKRRALSQVEMANSSQIICQKIIPLLQQFNKIAIYHPVDNEPDLRSLLIKLPDKLWLYPKITENTLCFNKIRDLESNKQYSRIWESTSSEFFIPEVIIIPGIAYNLENDRLGYGKGFYDRTIISLHEHGIKPLLIGICYKWQINDFNFIEPHDTKVDYIITD